MIANDEIHTLEHPKANTWKLKVMKEKGINDSPSHVIAMTC